MRPALSTAAAGLLRSFDRDRVLLTEFRSVDWQSLTFIGERHEISLRLPARDSASLIARLADRLEDVEWNIPGQIVADIALDGSPIETADGSVIVHIEALTIAE